MRPALATGLLGLVLVAAAMLFDAEPLWVPGVALTAIAVGSVAWVGAARRAASSCGARSARRASSRTSR